MHIYTNSLIASISGFVLCIFLLFPIAWVAALPLSALEPPLQCLVEVGARNVLMAPDVEIDSAAQRQLTITVKTCLCISEQSDPLTTPGINVALL